MPKWLKWTLGVIAGFFVLGAVFGNSEDKSKTTATAAGEPTSKTTSRATPTVKPVAFTVDAPAQSSTIHRARITLRGTADPQADLTIDDHAVRVEPNGRWHRTVGLHLGSNDFYATATKAGAEKTTMAMSVLRKRSASELRAFRRARAIKRAKRLAAKRAAAARRIANFKASATTLPYKQLEKNPDRHVGEKVKYTGQIFQIQEDGGSTWLLLSVTDLGYGMWDDHVWVNYDGTITGAEDDMITIYGTVAGEKSYETQIGGETYVPEVDARYIDE
jgi:Glucodextranase, domain B